MLNAFSIDVEDYFHVEAFSSAIDRDAWDGFESRVERNTNKCMDLLAGANTKATFFVLGWVAQRLPHLIRAIHSAGHEVACHGYSHQLIYRQNPQVFRTETVRAKQCLEDIIGSAVIGYRAASYSIVKQSVWALEILDELGFKYDSSINPIRHDLYGIPDAPRFAYRPAGLRLLEVPITTVQIMGQRLPCGGGGFFRLLPYSVFRAAVRRVNQSDRAAAVYCHPWELDPAQPRVAGLTFRSRFRHYTNLSKMEQRLKRLLTDFRWARMDSVFGVA